MESSLQGKRYGIAAVAAGFAVAAALGAFGHSQAYAVTAAEKEAEAQEALTQLSAMQDTLEQSSRKYYESLLEYQKATERCDKAQSRIDEITDEISGIQGRLGERAREMYRNGSTSFIDLLLGAASFDEFAKNWDLLTRLNTNDADMSARAKDLRDEAEEKKAEYSEQADVAEQKSAEASEAFKKSQVLVEQMQETYESLSAEAQELYAQEQAAAAAAAEAAAAAAAAEAEQYYAEGGEGYYEEPITEGGVQNDDGTVTDAATGEVYSSASEYSAATGNEIVDRAMSMLGASYEWGATGANGSFDCSGLVGYAITGTYDRIGNTTTFMGYNQVDDPQPGDIVVNEGHTGIYIGDGQMVHASDESTGVIVGDVQKGMIYVRP